MNLVHRQERELAALRAEVESLRDELARVRDERDDFARNVLRLLDTIKYLRGIGVRGEGREPRDGETTEAFVLGYVRRVESELAEARKDGLTFAAFRRANVTRCLKWHPAGIESWSHSDWLTAVTGELGELASLLKMRNRERDGLPGNKFSPTDKQIADEIADVFTYLDLLAAALHIDLGAAAAQKFNEVSERVGFPDRIDAARGKEQK